jgi:hypothetical protein
MNRLYGSYAFPKVFQVPADPVLMISSISNVHTSNIEQSQPIVPKAQPQAQPTKSGSVSQDQVTLKSAGDVDHDGDSK